MCKQTGRPLAYCPGESPKAALAATDPGRAERIAQSITDEYLKASALTNLARAAVLHAADYPEAVEPGRGR
jgi:hypothetical protein